jgi:Ca2+-dependent lipid-binding protein
MDVEGIRKWTWSVANKLIEAGEVKILDRFLTDLRSSNLPHEFANTIVNNITVFKKSGINVGEIRFDLQYFGSVTEFKQAKAIVTATIYNAKIQSEKKSQEEGGKE